MRGELAWHDARRPRGNGKRGKTPPLLPTLLGAYAAVGVLAAAVTVILDREPLETPSWTGVSGIEGASWSVIFGLGLAAGTIASTRLLVRHAAWARSLHAALRPAVHDVGGGPLALMALASGIAEELLFRGLLTPMIGVVLSSIAFGCLHQVDGRARFIWVAWASAMGLLFAILFEATGSLLGPMVAHVLINGVNLRYLRDTDVEGVSGNANRTMGVYGSSPPGTSAHEMP